MVDQEVKDWQMEDDDSVKVSYQAESMDRLPSHVA